MRATDIKPGKTYRVTAGRNETRVKVTNFNPRTGSWECETEAGKTISIKEVKRFLAEVGKKPSALQTVVEAVGSILPKGKKAATPETKKERAKGGKPKDLLSGLDAAHKVLLEGGRPMNAKEITEIAMQNGYCDLQGATPSLTISSAIQREIKAKPEMSRFVKIDKGMFAAR